MKILNRTLRWTSTGIEYEADDKHADIIVETCEVRNTKVMKTPGTQDQERAPEGDRLSHGETTRYRAVAARINYLSQDRPDIQFAAKELCRHMSAPTEADWEKARRVARYLRYRPRAYQKFYFEDVKDELTALTDSD